MLEAAIEANSITALGDKVMMNRRLHSKSRAQEFVHYAKRAGYRVPTKLSSAPIEEPPLLPA